MTKARSKKIWRSLDELAGAPDFRRGLGDEFAPGVSELKQFDRRSFLKLMGASFALAGIPACTRQPIELVVPYVNQPEQLVPGKPLFFATAMTSGGFATGLLVESHEGHPTKIEGNPGHPASLGATSVFHQAALLDLYDPDRSQTVLHHGQGGTWNDFVRALNRHLPRQAPGTGSRLRILTETITSPTLHSQIQSLLKHFPGAEWHQFAPINRDNAKAGAQLAFGEIVETHYHFDRAMVVVSLDSDFLYFHPNTLRYTRDFANGRRARFSQAAMSRLYVVESSPSITGANADHRLPLSWSEIQNFALRLVHHLGTSSPIAGPSNSAPYEKWLAAVAGDLLQHRGECVVIPGDNQPALVHALAHWLNDFLGNAGVTVTFTGCTEANPVNQMDSLSALTESLARSEVDTLIILGGNPVFNAPSDFDFRRAMSHANVSVHLGPDINETSRACDWHIPENHFLESWGDARAFDGTVSIIQPLILPLYRGKSALELLEAIVATSPRSDYDIVHDYWRENNPGDDFESHWRRALHDGWVQDSALPARKIALRSFEIPAPAAATPGLEITFRPDATISDGRCANNGWLQELPKPISKMVWDNAAYLSPSLAEKERLSQGDIIEISCSNIGADIGPNGLTPACPPPRSR